MNNKILLLTMIMMSGSVVYAGPISAGLAAAAIKGIGYFLATSTVADPSGVTMTVAAPAVVAATNALAVKVATTLLTITIIP